MTMLPITLTIAATAAILVAWLGIRVTLLRFRTNVSLGDGDDPAMVGRIRAHGNFAEYTPFVLVLMGLVELAGGNATTLWLVGAIYLVARLVHAFGIERPAPNPWRAIGAITTWVVLLGLAGWALAIVYGGRL